MSILVWFKWCLSAAWACLKPFDWFWGKKNILKILHFLKAISSRQVFCLWWKIWVRQWEGWHPIYIMENKIHVWNHQAVLMLTNSRYKKTSGKHSRAVLLWFASSQVHSDDTPWQLRWCHQIIQEILHQLSMTQNQLWHYKKKSFLRWCTFEKNNIFLQGSFWPNVTEHQHGTMAPG